MNTNQGPIVVIEDDIDDRFLLGCAFEAIGCTNKVLYFANGVEALFYLKYTEEHPFIIFADINVPKISGLQLREIINLDEKLKLKCIPFIFFTASTSPTDIKRAYEECIQGFFCKHVGISQFESTIKRIVDYWTECLTPE